MNLKRQQRAGGLNDLNAAKKMTTMNNTGTTFENASLADDAAKDD